MRRYMIWLGKVVFLRSFKVRESDLICSTWRTIKRNKRMAPYRTRLCNFCRISEFKSSQLILIRQKWVNMRSLTRGTIVPGKNIASVRRSESGIWRAESRTCHPSNLERHFLDAKQSLSDETKKLNGTSIFSPGQVARDLLTERPRRLCSLSYLKWENLNV